MQAPLLRLAYKSLINRRVTALLTIAAIALSVLLLLGVEKVRTGARDGFANTISGTDLIVGARSGSVQLLLYSVFRIGDATQDISWESYQDIKSWREVAWSAPISLGDSHRGYRVIGTVPAFYEHYRYGRRQALQLADGQLPNGLFEAVIGADVADELGYVVGQKIIIAHGTGAFGFNQHDDKPFTVVGIFDRTGTPVDRSVHVGLEAIEAIHIDWQDGRAPGPGQAVSAEVAARMDLTPKRVTAVLLGLKSRIATFQVQRRINTYPEEALLAILPGVALEQLWQAIGGIEVALLAISIMVVVTGFMGMMAVSLSALNERRREMAILRSVGARPIHIFTLLVLESGFLAASGAILGTVALYAGLLIAQPVILSRFGFYLPIDPPGMWEAALLGMVLIAGLVSGMIPAALAYRRSLSDGMAMRV